MLIKLPSKNYEICFWRIKNWTESQLGAFRQQTRQFQECRPTEEFRSKNMRSISYCSRRLALKRCHAGRNRRKSDSWFGRLVLRAIPGTLQLPGRITNR